MIIILKDKETLEVDDFSFKCSIGKKGVTNQKIEGDKKTPQGTFTLGNLYYRGDRKKKPNTKLKCINIKKDMGWCDDPRSKKNYNRLIKIKNKINFSYEKLYRRNSIYNYFISINFNQKKIRLGKGSAIFLHITKNYKKTLGCIALSEKDFIILAKLVNKKTKIKIY